MPTEDNDRVDEVAVSLNGDNDPDQDHVDLPRIGKRPADSAAKGEWVDYCVALGADRHYLENLTEHYDGTAYVDGVEQAVYEQHPALTKEELVDLADRLGG